jgi:hypothetical protein
MTDISDMKIFGCVFSLHHHVVLCHHYCQRHTFGVLGQLSLRTATLPSHYLLLWGNHPLRTDLITSSNKSCLKKGCAIMPRRITTTTLLLLVALLSLSSMALAFTTTTPTGPSSSTAASKKKLPFFSPIRVMSGVSSPAAFLGSKGSVLFLSDEKQETEAGAVAEKPATTPGEGTFYDDEVSSSGCRMG